MVEGRVDPSMSLRGKGHQVGMLIDVFPMLEINLRTSRDRINKKGSILIIFDVLRLPLGEVIPL